MGCQVNLSSGCMFDWACIHTVPHIERGGTLNNGRLNMSNMQIWGCRETNKGETLINMGSEVDLPSSCMFRRYCIYTVLHIYQGGGLLYIGRLHMSSMQIWGWRKTNKGETLINMGYEVHLPSGWMFERDYTRTVPYVQRGGTFYIGRLNMSNMQIWGFR